MTIDNEQLKLGLKLRKVDRFPTYYLPIRQKVDQHSFRATLLYIHLGGKEIIPMLCHDIEEAVTGDIPSPVKKDLDGLDIYEKMRPPFEDKDEKKLGKLCDKLELVLDIKEQRQYFGNVGESIMEIYENELECVLDMARELKLTRQVKKILKEKV